MRRWIFGVVKVAVYVSVDGYIKFGQLSFNAVGPLNIPSFWRPYDIFLEFGKIDIDEVTRWLRTLS